jgi:UPF0042 nucleotide-binding protein
LSSLATPKRLLLVTGLSGAGKSTVLNTLEDLDWEVVDNLPLSLLSHLLATPPSAGSADDRPLAIGLDSRTRGFDARKVVGQIKRLAKDGDHPLETLYLDCSGHRADPTLFGDAPAPSARNRPAGDRRHRGGARPDGAAAALGGSRHRHVGQRLQRPSPADQGAVRRGPRRADISVLSFGFARGLPRNADLVFDMRFLKNPHWQPSCARSPGETRRSPTMSERTRPTSRR